MSSSDEQAPNVEVAITKTFGTLNKLIAEVKNSRSFAKQDFSQVNNTETETASCELHSQSYLHVSQDDSNTELHHFRMNEISLPTSTQNIAHFKQGVVSFLKFDDHADISSGNAPVPPPRSRVASHRLEDWTGDGGAPNFSDKHARSCQPNVSHCNSNHCSDHSADDWTGDDGAPNFSDEHARSCQPNVSHCNSNHCTENLSKTSSKVNSGKFKNKNKNSKEKCDENMEKNEHFNSKSSQFMSSSCRPNDSDCNSNHCSDNSSNASSNVNYIKYKIKNEKSKAKYDENMEKSEHFDSKSSHFISVSCDNNNTDLKYLKVDDIKLHLNLNDIKSNQLSDWTEQQGRDLAYQYDQYFIGEEIAEASDKVLDTDIPSPEVNPELADHNYDTNWTEQQGRDLSNVLPQYDQYFIGEEITEASDKVLDTDIPSPEVNPELSDHSYDTNEVDNCPVPNNADERDSNCDENSESTKDCGLNLPCDLENTKTIGESNNNNSNITEVGAGNNSDDEKSDQYSSNSNKLNTNSEILYSNRSGDDDKNTYFNLPESSVNSEQSYADSDDGIRQDLDDGTLSCYVTRNTKDLSLEDITEEEDLELAELVGSDTSSSQSGSARNVTSSTDADDLQSCSDKLVNDSMTANIAASAHFNQDEDASGTSYVSCSDNDENVNGKSANLVRTELSDSEANLPYHDVTCDPTSPVTPRLTPRGHNTPLHQVRLIRSADSEASLPYHDVTCDPTSPVIPRLTPRGQEDVSATLLHQVRRIRRRLENMLKKNKTS